MTTLILVTSDAAAGHLKHEQRTDHILWFTHRLVTGPVPVGGTPESFFQRRRAIYVAERLFQEAWWFEAEAPCGSDLRVRREWSRLLEICIAHDRVELWIDPIRMHSCCSCSCSTGWAGTGGSRHFSG